MYPKERKKTSGHNMNIEGKKSSCLKLKTVNSFNFYLSHARLFIFLVKYENYNKPIIKSKPMKYSLTKHLI